MSARTPADEPAPVDPIRFEVIRNSLVAATDEMALALRRSAYSTNIKTRSDFSPAFFDADLRSVAQGFAQPVHLGSLVELVPSAVREYGPENLGPGDAILTNLVKSGRIVDDVFRLVLAQIRSKHVTGGDFRAQVAAGNTGVRRLHALLDRHGSRLVARYMAEILAYTERRTRSELEKLPRGVFEAAGQIDTDGYSEQPVRLPVRVVIDESGVLFDLSQAEPQRRAPVNSTFAQTFSACAYALKCLADPDLPANDGFYRLVRVEAPPGTVANCTAPAPVVGGWETQTRLVDVIFKALAPVLRESVPAGTKAMMCHAGFGGADPLTGDYYCYLETLGGGYGGRAGSDGPDAVQTHGQNTENAPIEEAERDHVRVGLLQRLPRLPAADRGPGSDHAGAVP